MKKSYATKDASTVHTIEEKGWLDSTTVRIGMEGLLLTTMMGNGNEQAFLPVRIMSASEHQLKQMQLPPKGAH